jgi:hypothetical protein
VAFVKPAQGLVRLSALGKRDLDICCFVSITRCVGVSLTESNL